MVNLRNLPFYFVGIVCLLLGLTFYDSIFVWHIFAGIFIIMGVVFRKEIDTSDSDVH